MIPLSEQFSSVVMSAESDSGLRKVIMFAGDCVDTRVYTVLVVKGPRPAYPKVFGTFYEAKDYLLRWFEDAEYLERRRQTKRTPSY